MKQSSELFTYGFSQGGHSALALQRLLERRHVDVTATASVGGVYDVERWFLAMLADETTVTLPLYVAYLLLAYDDIYDVYGQPSDVFGEQYADTLPGLFDMQHYWDDVLAGLPPTSRELLQQSYFDAVQRNPADPMRVRLRQNAVDRWRPDAPIRIYHSPTDEEVFYEDALVSIDRLQRRGATSPWKGCPATTSTAGSSPFRALPPTSPHSIDGDPLILVAAQHPEHRTVAIQGTTVIWTDSAGEPD